MVPFATVGEGVVVVVHKQLDGGPLTQHMFARVAAGWSPRDSRPNIAQQYCLQKSSPQPNLPQKSCQKRNSPILAFLRVKKERCHYVLRLQYER